MKYSQRTIFLKSKYTVLFLPLLILFYSCSAKEATTLPSVSLQPKGVVTTVPIKKSLQDSIPKLLIAADNTTAYLPLLQGKRIAVVTNQSGLVHTFGETISIVDFLIQSHQQVTKIMVPEHGFRGEADAGQSIKNGLDSKTNLPIVSLYGKNKKPTKSQLQDVDMVLFDIQDVGVRFYTYISTLHYVMEACAEQNLPIIVLDRPNPNAHYIDGPVLSNPAFKSFVGMHPVPIVYGMTIGEYAQMINGEGWLDKHQKADLTIIPLKNYFHSMEYKLPVKPSPNLPNSQSINLYPSLCFFEGTNVSVGRGTDFPFQVYGAPYFTADFTFTPVSKNGASKPMYQGEVVRGYNLQQTDKKLDEINLNYLITAYNQSKKAGVENEFWLTNNFINLLAGTDQLKKQIIQGLSNEEIHQTWQNELIEFKKIRKKYLLYP